VAWGSEYSASLGIKRISNKRMWKMQIKLLKHMRKSGLYWATAALLVVAGNGIAETGMGLVVTTTTFRDLRIGAIRRIDLVNDLVTNTTGTIGNGTGPRFSPTGQQFCFLQNGGNTVVIATIDGVVIRSFSVVAVPGDGGTLSWTNSGIWVGVEAKIVKYDTNGVLLSTYTTSSGDRRGMVSRNEITGGAVNTSSWFPIVYNMRRNNRILPATTGAGCSVCPNPSGTRLTNNLFESSSGPNGSDGNHRAMRLLDTAGHQTNFLYLKDIVPSQFTGSSYHADMQSWSGNSDDWILIPVGQDNGDLCPSKNCSPCIYNISTGQKVCLKDNSTANGTQWQPFDYYSGWAPTTTNPVLQVSPTTLSFAIDSGSTNPPTQNITASTSTGTISGLTVSGAKSWLTVTPAVTSGASITITNAVNIAGLAPNTYLDTITVNTTNAGSKTYTITLTVRRPAVTAILTSMTVSPGQYTVAAGASISFLATCKDQAGKYFTGATMAWTASGGGTIDQSGRYTASATPTHGPHRIIATATAGSVSLRDTAWLVVSTAKNVSIHKRIDCGANSYLPAGWESDDAYLTGGSDYDLTATISITGIPAAAPANVYKSVRHGSPHSYRIPSLPEGYFYTTRIHLVDWKDTTRLMSYTILGTNVLNNFTVSSLAGGANQPLVLDFTAIAADTNGIPIACSAASGDVFEAGFEVMQNFLKPVTLLAPLGGQIYSVGQVMPVQFRNDTVDISQMYIELSVDGRTYINFTGNYGIFMSDMRSTWGNYNWTIPDSIGPVGSRVSTISTRCKIRVRPYNDMGGGVDVSDSAFTIKANSATIAGNPISSAGDRLNYAIIGDLMSICASSAIAFRIDVFSLTGERIFSSTGIGDRTYSLPKATAQGIALVRMKTASGNTLVKTVLGASGN
jgi:hypothetical protein